MSSLLLRKGYIIHWRGKGNMRTPFACPENNQMKDSSTHSAENWQTSVIECFQKHFLPDAVVVYSRLLSRSDEDDTFRTIDADGNEERPMPDVVLYNQISQWFYLIDVTGCITAERAAELRDAFSHLSARLSLVSAFRCKEEWIEHVDQIAWETVVWFADEPEHLVVYNGERFLTPR
jgi:hypothetical protein